MTFLEQILGINYLDTIKCANVSTAFNIFMKSSINKSKIKVDC